MEHKLAMYIVKQLNKIYPRTELENIKMAYGLEIILDNGLKLICIMMLAAFLGFLRETLLVLTGFGVLRLSAGGRHLDKSSLCLVFSSLVTIGGGFLVRLHIFTKEECIIALVLALIITAVYAPSGTANNPIHDKYKKILKIRSLFTIGVYVFFVMFWKDITVGNALAIGAVCEAITILPIVNPKYSSVKENT